MKFKEIAEFARFLWGDALSEPQIVVLKSLYGMPLNRAQRSLWRKYCAKSTFARYTPREFREATLLIGRQAGKSAQIGTTVALWESLCVDRRIPEGQRQTCLILTPTLRQSTFGKVAEKLVLKGGGVDVVKHCEANAAGELCVCERHLGGITFDDPNIAAVQTSDERFG